MNELIYMPVFRFRQQEKKVLTSFDFEDSISPCIEIIKELEVQPRKKKEEATKEAKKTVIKAKTFEEVYLPILSSIKSDQVFVDLPVHLKERTQMKPEVLTFLRKVISNRALRTEYMLKLESLSKKIIPVISTYSQRSGEPNSIVLQENDLRPKFPRLAFRTFEGTLTNDLQQISIIAQPTDYLILDLEDHIPDPSDEYVIIPIMEKLKNFKSCPVIILRSAIPNSIKNFEIEHGVSIENIDNRLIYNYDKLAGNGFGDYVGIKKDNIEKGGGISPGFIFFDPVGNLFYGYKGSEKRELIDFEKIIVPDVIASHAVERMRRADVGYLDENSGWNIIKNIEAELESGKSMAKFKRVSMEHYLHCLRAKIRAGHYHIH